MKSFCDWMLELRNECDVGLSSTRMGSTQELNSTPNEVRDEMHEEKDETAVSQTYISFRSDPQKQP